MPINTQFFTDDWSSSAIEDLVVRAGKNWRIVYPAGSTRQIKTSGSVGTGAQASYPAVAGGTVGTQTFYYGGTAATTADARVTAVVNRDAGGESGSIFLIARASGTDAATANFYGVRLQITLGGNTVTATLFKVLAGGAITNIASTSGAGTFAAANGVDLPVEFIVSGSTLTMNSNSVLIATATDTSIAAAGYVGVGAEKTNTAASGGLVLRPGFIGYQADPVVSTINLVGSNASQSATSSTGTVTVTPPVAGVVNLAGSSTTGGATSSTGVVTVTPVMGTITSAPFAAWGSPTPLAAANMVNVTVTRVSDRVQVLSLANQVLNGSGVMVLTNAAIVIGVWYMLATWNADGSLRSFKAYLAT